MSEHNNTLDAGLEDLEESANRGEPWKYPTKPTEEWDPGMPNPLVIRVAGLSTGVVNGDELTFVNGHDKTGKKWSRTVGSKVLRAVLLDGIISEWDDDRQAYVEVRRVGPVRPGERVSILFRGFTTIKTGEHKGKEIASLKVERPDAETFTPTAEPAVPGAGADDDIPFQPSSMDGWL
jgi:hypothetical protein